VIPLAPGERDDGQPGAREDRQSRRRFKGGNSRTQYRIEALEHGQQRRLVGALFGCVRPAASAGGLCQRSLGHFALVRRERGQNLALLPLWDIEEVK
jgi:hypothetical protein